jgi:DNA-binding MarR family transcriptional regulator
MNEFSQCPTEGALGLLALLIKSGRYAESRLDAALEEARLTFSKWRALDTLVKAELPIALKELTGKLQCVKSNITQIADKLEADGLARRVPDPDDRRATRIELTADGRRAHEAGANALRNAAAELFTALSDADLEELRKRLRRLDTRNEG